MTDLPTTPTEPTPEPTPEDNTEGTRTALCALMAIVFPPLGAFLKVGFGGHLWLNILLTIFGYVPGILHALWVVIRKEEKEEATQ